MQFFFFGDVIFEIEYVVYLNILFTWFYFSSFLKGKIKQEDLQDGRCLEDSSQDIRLR